MTMENEAPILDRAAMADRCTQWRAEGRKVVFTNGVFDLVHRGHVTLNSELALEHHCDQHNPRKCLHRSTN